MIDRYIQHTGYTFSDERYSQRSDSTMNKKQKKMAKAIRRGKIKQ